MNMNVRNLKNQKGFTMIEVISVLVIITIIAAIAVIRLADSADVDFRAKREVLKSHIRYTQSRSIHSNRVWGIHFSGAAYSLFAYDSETAAMITPAPMFPNHNSASVPMPPGLTATGVITFDFFGKPYYAADLSAPGNLTQTPYTGGTGQTTIDGVTITPETGFVP